MKRELKRFDILQELTSGELALLEDLLETRNYEQNSVLFRRDDEADSLFLVADGSIAVELDRRALAELGPGDTLGANSLVVIGNRECDARALAPTRVLELTREGYMRLRIEQPSAALALQEGILRAFASHVRGVLADRRRKDAG